MDNITHSLAGIALAEAALALRARRAGSASPALTRATWLASIAGNNAPDLDLVLAPLTRGPLGYLLHHRGHTHTTLVAPLVGLLLVPLVARAVPPRERRNHLAWLALIAALGTWLHMLMDGANNYGIHPFWPLDARWVFGDTLFIVEPWLWVTLASPFILAVPGWRRAAFAILPITGVLLGFASGMVAPEVLGLLAAVPPVLAYLGGRLAQAGRASLAIASSVLVVVLFALGSVQARAVAEAEIARGLGSLQVLALHPTPGNPLCWSGEAVTERDATLEITRLAVSLSPSWRTAEGCRPWMPRAVTFPRQAVAASSSPAVWFVDAVRLDRAVLRASLGTCHGAAFARYARVPLVLDRGATMVFGDARYDFAEGLEWSEVEVRPGDPCPERVPPWEPPTSGWLAAPSPGRPGETW